MYSTSSPHPRGHNVLLLTSGVITLLLLIMIIIRVWILPPVNMYILIFHVSSKPARQQCADWCLFCKMVLCGMQGDFLTRYLDNKELLDKYQAVRVCIATPPCCLQNITNISYLGGGGDIHIIIIS